MWGSAGELLVGWMYADSTRRVSVQRYDGAVFGRGKIFIIQFRCAQEMPNCTMSQPRTQASRDAPRISCVFSTR